MPCATSSVGPRLMGDCRWEQLLRGWVKDSEAIRTYRAAIFVVFVVIAAVNKIAVRAVKLKVDG